MAEPNLKIILTAVDNASATLKGVTNTFLEHRKQIGLAMVAVGGAITGVAALAIKSSQEQMIGIARLEQSLYRIGVSYQSEKAAIEASISAMQRKTNYSDEEQRGALERLVTLTGQYNLSLQALPAVLDIAAALQIDLSSAATLVAKALGSEEGKQGLLSALSRYGVVLKDNATPTEILSALTEKFGGTAAAAANPVTQLKNKLDDLAQVLGDALLPILTPIVDGLSTVIDWIQRWADANPKLADTIGIITAAISAFLLVCGTLTLVAPAIAAAWVLATGPVGLVVAAIAVLIAIGVLLYKNWGTIARFFSGIWDKIAGFFKDLGEGFVIVGGIIADAWSTLWEGCSKVVKGIWGGIMGVIRGGVNGIIDAINFLIRALNNIHFTLPGWIPGIGGQGFGISIPEIPNWGGSAENYDKGGVVPGPIGSPRLAIVHGGETVTPAGGMMVNIYLDGRFIGQHLGQQAVRAEQVRSS